jgi:hypothetical protein
VAFIGCHVSVRTHWTDQMGRKRTSTTLPRLHF